MSWPDSIFRNAPELKGRLTPLKDSRLRLSKERYAQIDADLAKAGIGPEWRLTDEAREASRMATLEGRWDRELWVFAYGSLIWDPALHISDIHRAVLPGWRRSFCMKLDGGRGTPENPGLMCSLEPGGRCEGVVLRLDPEVLDEETELLWRREMIAGTYRPGFADVETRDGAIEALGFFSNPDHDRHEHDLDFEETARRIATAEGTLGRNSEYLESLVEHLEALGIHDEDIFRLWKRVREIQGGA